MKKRYHIIVLIMAAALGVLSSQTIRAAEQSVSLTNGAVTSLQIHVGDTGQLTTMTDGLVDYTGQPVTVASWSWSSYDSGVVGVDANGCYRAFSPGSAMVSVQGYSEYGSVVFSASCYFTVTVDMTNVTLDRQEIKEYITGYEGISADVKINSPIAINSQNSQFSYTSSNPEMGVSCSLYENVLHIQTYYAGNTSLTVVINGKTFVINIRISRLEITKRSFVTSKGKKVTLKVKGTSDKAVWSSSNSRVAKVSSNGTVRFRKNGNAVITANLKGKKVGCAVSVISPKLLKVVKRARYIGAHWKYSQPKRMQNGYYDCSSLVWKAYSRIGRKLVMANYAPVAADLAKWCKQHGKVLSKSYTRNQIQKMKFRPGDLMFETGMNNGRYKGIYHVEMFVGYAVSYYDEAGKPVLNELWAARPEGYYGGGHLIERP